jgi:hypothetical protein
MRGKGHVYPPRRIETVGICNLLDWLNVIAGNECVVCVEKLDASFLKRPLGYEQSLCKLLRPPPR